MHSVLVDKKTKKIKSVIYDNIIQSSDPTSEVLHLETGSAFNIYEAAANILNKPPSNDLEQETYLIKRYALGDVLMLLPVLNSLKKNNPNITINFSTDEWLQPLLTKIDFIDELVEAESMLAYNNYVDLEGKVDKLLETKHRSEYFADYFEDTYLLECQPDWNFEFIFEECEFTKELLSIYEGNKVVLSPVSKSPYRIWGKELELVEQCPDWNFFVLHSDKLEEFDGISNVLNLSGELDICQAATVCKYSDFGIVPDSGIMHLLGILEKPFIGLFGNVTNPNNRISQYSYGFPITTEIPEKSSSPFCKLECCYEVTAGTCKDKDYFRWCMEEISVKDVKLAVYENIYFLEKKILPKTTSTNNIKTRSISGKTLLPDVTLLVIDSYSYPRDISHILNVCSDNFKFGDIRIIANTPIQFDHSLPHCIDTFKVLGTHSNGLIIYSEVGIDNYEKFRVFMLKKLLDYIKTEFVMTCYWDAFIVNPTAWTDGFLKYDYLGAPVIWDPSNDLIKDKKLWREINTGKGRFSIRSRNLLEALKDNKVYDPYLNYNEYEDYCIARVNRGYLQEVKGIKYAPYEICNKFSIYGGKWANQFGFESFSTDLTDWEQADKFGMEYVWDENFHKFYSHISKNIFTF